MAQERIDSIYDLASLNREQRSVVEGLQASKKAIVDLYNTIQQFKTSNFATLAENTDKLTKATIQANKATQAALDTAIKQEKLKQLQIKTAQLERDEIEKTTAALKKQSAEKQKNAEIPFTSNLNADGSINEPARGKTTGTVVNQNDINAVNDIIAANAEYTASEKQASQAKKESKKSSEQLANEELRDQKIKIEDKILNQQRNKDLLLQVKEENAVKGSLEQRRLALQRLQAQYDKLSASERSEAFGQRQLQIIQGLNTQVGQLEKATGRSQRDVGSYGAAISKAFGNAFGYVRQLANILPGIGLAGLFGIAIDAITSLVQKFVQGSGAINVFKQNLQNANDVVADANKKAGEEIATLKILYGAATNVNASQQERIRAAVDLQKTYPETFKNFSAEDIALGKAKKGYDDLTNSIIAQARAQSAKAKIDELETQRLDILFQKQKIINATNAEAARAQTFTETISGGTGGVGTIQNTVTAEDQRATIRARRDKALREQDVKDAALAQQEKFLISFVGEKAITKVVEDEVESRQKAAKKAKPDTTAEDRAKEAFQALIKYNDEAAQAELDTLQTIANGEAGLTSIRVLALKKYLEAKSALIEADAENEIVLNNSTAAQALAIRQKAQNEILKLQLDTSDKINKLLSDADKKQKDAALKREEDFQDQIIAIGDAAYERLKKNQKDREDDAKKKAEEEKSIQEQLYDAIKRAAENAYQFINALADAGFERRMNQIQAEIDANNLKYSTEIQNIQNSSLTDEQKKQRTIQLQATQNAKEVQLQQQLNREKQKQAKVDRDAQALYILGEAIAAHFKIIAQLGAAGIPIAIANDVAAALQIATLYAKPLPTYKEGLHSDKADHFGIHGEAGAEWVKKPGEPGFISDKPTLDFLPKGTRIKPLTGDIVDEMMNRQLMRGVILMQGSKRDESLEVQKKMLKALSKRQRVNVTVKSENKELWKYLNIYRG